MVLAAPWLVRALLLAAAGGLGSGLRPSEEDFAFEPDSESQQPQQPQPQQQQQQHAHAPASPAPVQRQWGVQDTTATAGKLLRFTVPADAFSGDVDHYEVRGVSGLLTALSGLHRDVT